MLNLYYIHWHEAECLTHADALKSAGYEVRSHWSKDSNAKITDDTDALIVSLDRLPSHGRAIAEWFWEAKKRQVKPLIFVGGEPAKVAETMKKFPAAVYCTRTKLNATLEKLFRTPVSEPPAAPKKRKNTLPNHRPAKPSR